MSNSLITTNDIESRIFTIRGMQVMLDRDLAELYGVETRIINQSVKRNIERFPSSFMFQLNENEFNILKSQYVFSSENAVDKEKSLISQIVISNSRGGLRKMPFAFTEQGVSMLSAVLRSSTAIAISIRIIETFVAMRKLISANMGLIQRVEGIEQKQIETDKKIDKIFNALESKDSAPTFGVFYQGQIFDAYIFASDLIKTAKKTIILLDNYVDESVLLLLSKRQAKVDVQIYTRLISDKLKLDLTKHNSQYDPIKIIESAGFHDRFLIIDGVVYHIGASLKDLGKSLFAFSKMELDGISLLEKLQFLMNEETYRL